MKGLSIDHPTDRPNFTLVYIDAFTLAFSYKTLIGYAPRMGNWTLAENTWGATTGKHLNWLDDRHERRIPWEQMHDEAMEHLKGYGVADLEVAADNAVESLRTL